jgi:hypothetical protein
MDPVGISSQSSVLLHVVGAFFECVCCVFMIAQFLIDENS